MNTDLAAGRQCDSAYYQSLHDTSKDYRQSNWLLEDLPALRAAGGDSIIEIGCGNGLFLARAAQHWNEVTGVDWARSAVLDEVLRAEPRIRFAQQDIAEFAPARRYDLLVSADFLEHLAPPRLVETLTRLHAAADACYHRIACYDDGHSHLSIFGAAAWLRLFEQAAPGAGYRVVKKAYRLPRRRKKLVVVISNLGARK